MPLYAYDTLAPLLPGTSPLVGRAFAAVALVRVAEGCSWSAAAVRLGVDTIRAKRLVDAIRPRIDGDALWREMQRLAKEWPSFGLTDFGQRREALGSVMEIDPDAFRTMLLRLGLGPRWARAGGRNGAAWAWEHIAGGDARTSPALLGAEASGVSRASAREVYRRFCLWLPDDFRVLLTAWAFDSCGLGPVQLPGADRAMRHSA